MLMLITSSCHNDCSVGGCVHVHGGSGVSCNFTHWAPNKLNKKSVWKFLCCFLSIFTLRNSRTSMPVTLEYRSFYSSHIPRQGIFTFHMERLNVSLFLALKPRPNFTEATRVHHFPCKLCSLTGKTAQGVFLRARPASSSQSLLSLM